MAAPDQEIRFIGRQGNCSLKRRYRLIELIEMCQRQAPAMVDRCLIWSNHKRAVTGFERFGMPFQHAKKVGAVDQRADMLAVQSQRRVISAKRLIVPRHVAQNIRAVVMECRVTGIRSKRPFHQLSALSWCPRWDSMTPRKCSASG